MQQKHWLVLLLFLLIPGVIFAQSGKIRGTVVDQKTKEPLVGANIVVEGTNMGAATDVDGLYMIINVPVGTYTIKASYVGYRTFTISNIRISGQLTTEVNLDLSSEDVQVQTVEIVAERPLINKNATGAVRLTTAEDIQNIPVRGVGNIVALAPGVVLQNNNIYIRGGRQDQVGYIIEGVQSRDPLFGGNTATIIDNAIEEIQVHTGGFNAEFGNANAGIIITALKTGGDKLKVTGEIITDAWHSAGEKALGTYGYGYSEYTVTVGGPIPEVENLKFFVAGNNNFNRVNQNDVGLNQNDLRFTDGMDLRGVYDKSLDKTDANGNLIRNTYDLVYPAGTWLNDASNRWTINGNIYGDFKPFTVKLSGTYSTSTQHQALNNANLNGILGNVFNQIRAPLFKSEDMTASAHFTHVLSQSTFYEVNAGFSRSFQKTMDPFLQDDWKLYGDSVANAAYGFTLKGQGQVPDPIIIFGTSLDAYGTPESFYSKILQDGYSVNANVVHQEGRTHEIKAGFEYRTNVIRRFTIARDFTMSYALQKQNHPTYSDYDILKGVRLDNYGYSASGDLSDDLPDGMKPFKPVFMAGYAQDKIEYEDLVINAGVRYDYINIDQLYPADITKIVYNADGLIDANQLRRADARSYISPRIGFAFPVTDRTVFHAQWGKFVEQSRLRDIYYGIIAASTNIKGGNATQNNIGWNLAPERTTSYELGFNQMLTDNSSFDITMYYRNIIGQIQERYISRAEGANHQSYFAFVNGDFATTKGLEFKLTMRRTERVAAQAFYSYADAKGTGSNSSSSFRTIWQNPTGGTPFYPLYVTPLDYNQAHRGNISLDYRFAENDGGPVLERIGLNLLFSFNSGHNYTRIGYQYGNTRIPTEEVNASTTPWEYMFDLRLDKSFRVGPVDLNVYIWVINLLNTKNVENVFLQTGTSDDDAYLATAQGQLNIETYGPYYAPFYRAILASGYGWEAGDPLDRNLWGTPRQIRLGIRVEY
jgi:outer membrane receptor protein involved in Fe transport